MKRHRWTTVWRNGEVTPAGEELLGRFRVVMALTEVQQQAQATRLSPADAEKVGRQTGARQYGASRRSVLCKSRVEWLAGCG